MSQPISRKSNRKARVNIGILAVLVLGYLWGFFAYWSSSSREQLFVNTEQSLDVKSRAIQQYAHDLFKVAAIFNTTTERWLEANPSRDPRTDRTFSALIQDLRQQTDELIEIRLVGSNGSVFSLASEKSGLTTTAAELEFIKTSSRSKPGQVLISVPTIGGTTGQARLAITSRLRQAHGQFDAINASVNIRNLLAFLERERIKPNGTVTLWRSDGTAVLRISPQGAYVPHSESLSQIELVQIRNQSGAISLNYRNTGDGQTEVITYAKRQNSPLIVSMTASVSDTLDEWKQHRNTIMSLLAIATLVIGLLSLRLVTVLGILEEDTLALEKLATTDSLTGLFSRRHFHNLCSQEIERASRYNESFSLLIIDIDFFKKINDTWGHPAGDRVLKEISHSLGSLVRIPDFCARIGGEEFAVALPNTDALGANRIAERIRSGIAEQPVTVGQEKDVSETIRVTVSVGAATYRKNDDFGAMFGRADKALYRAKASGRNRVEVEQPTDK